MSPRFTPSPVLIPKGEGGLMKDSVALCNQIRSVDEARFGKTRGHVSPGTMGQYRPSVEDQFGAGVEAAPDSPPSDLFSGNSIEGVYVAVNLSLRLALGDLQGVRRLQVHPKCGRSTEIAGQAKGVSEEMPRCPWNDVGDAALRDAQIPGNPV